MHGCVVAPCDTTCETKAHPRSGPGKLWTIRAHLNVDKDMWTHQNHYWDGNKRSWHKREGTGHPFGPQSYDNKLVVYRCSDHIWACKKARFLHMLMIQETTTVSWIMITRTVSRWTSSSHKHLQNEFSVSTCTRLGVMCSSAFDNTHTMATQDHLHNRSKAECKQAHTSLV